MLKTVIPDEERFELRKEAEFILKEVGFSSYAAQTFVSVCESSPISASGLCERTGIPDSKIYYALKEIEDAGLVTRIGGTPQLYASLEPGEVAETLKKILRSRYKKQETIITRLENILGPISKRSQRKDQLEIAYIARGFDSITRRLRNMLSSAKREIVGYVWDEQVYSAVSEDIREIGDKDDVKLKLAINPKFDNKYPCITSERKVLSCNCNIFITDARKMITITRTEDDSYYAIITEDPGMVSLGLSYYDNPACCAT